MFMHKLRGNIAKMSLLVLLLVSLVIIGWTQIYKQPNTDLPNFHKVNEHLYRGGQPGKGGMKKLADLGVKTIINIRGESSDTRAEGVEAKSLSMDYYNIPVARIERPSNEHVKQIMSIIGKHENGPVFIHCQRGADRTGVIIAAYRIKHDGWSAKQAINEANNFGMGWIQFPKRNYIQDVANMNKNTVN